ncbi:MAG: hypothetical protein C0504_07830 [Candidatus Solibacter sp.]|nr:hypothetical protein [Candidatus Solibacter sp.]
MKLHCAEGLVRWNRPMPACWICFGLTSAGPKTSKVGNCGMNALAESVCAMLPGSTAARRNSGLASVAA